MSRCCVGALWLGLLTLGSAWGAEPRAAKPLNLTVNTAADEDEPFPASSGLTLYYSSNAKEKSKLDIMVSQRRNGLQPWPRGALLDWFGATPADDRSVFVTRDGRYPQFLYYATRKDRDAKNYDIYVTVRQDRSAVFSEPTPINRIDTEADELHPWLSADGRQLFFTRKTEEGLRVHVASRANAGGPQGFGEPQVVASIPAGFCHATLTPDGKTMILQGPVEGKENRLGLFRATAMGKGWSKPEPLDMVNSSEGEWGDCSPALSWDGRLLYFASDRPGGKGGLDLYVIPTAALTGKKGS